MTLAFDARYYANRLRVVNRRGDAGIVTFWTPISKVVDKLAAVAPHLLDPAQSRVAVIGNLYGDGLHAMFCNLLYNPQIRHLAGVVNELSHAVVDDLEAFLANGVEDVDVEGVRMTRVRGTTRVLLGDDAFDVDRLRRQVRFRRLDRLSKATFVDELAGWYDDLPAAQPADGDRVVSDLVGIGDGPRPSARSAHQVVRAKPLQCWRELVVRVMRFGQSVGESDSRRLELLHVKAVVTEPETEPGDALAANGFDLAGFVAYQQRILDPTRPDDAGYTYGNRLRGYFAQPEGGTDALAAVAAQLRREPLTRHAYLSLWDTSTDRTRRSAPCLTTVQFRSDGDRLSLGATYRVHNLLGAWLENVYGLMAVQRFVCDAAGLSPGDITVVSHILGIDPSSERFARAVAIEQSWTNDDDRNELTGRYELRQDPHGRFAVYVDRDAGTIVAEHFADGLIVKRYEHTRAERLSHDIMGDMAVSLPSHALWLGRELMRCEGELRTGDGGADR